MSLHNKSKFSLIIWFLVFIGLTIIFVTSIIPPAAATIDSTYIASNACTEQIQDGGFEQGSPNPQWDEASTNFGTPICDEASCGTGTGSGAHSGTYWAWFGGISAYEEGSVSQQITIPSGTATLSFWLEQIVCDSGSDYMEVTLDGNPVFTTNGSSSICGNLGYTQESIDISAFADGNVHQLKFHSEIFANNGGGSNFFVDDVSVVACEAPTPTPTSTTAPTSTPTPTPTITPTSMPGSVIYDTWIKGSSQRPSPSVNDLTIDPTNPQIVYAATEEGVYKSTDGGNTWHAKLNGLSAFGGLAVSNVVINPNNPQNLYIATWGDGIYVSMDGGENWVLKTDPVENIVRTQHDGLEFVHPGGMQSEPPSLGTAHIQKETPNQIDPEISASHLEPIVPDTAWQKQKPSLQDNFDPTIELSKPTNPNHTFSQGINDDDNVNLPPREIDWTPVRHVAMHPTNPQRLIAAISDGNGLYITQNGGDSWNQISLPGSGDVSGRSVAFAPSNPNIVYASLGNWGSNDGIYRSTNSGNSWTLVSGNSTITSVVTMFAIDPTDANHVYAASYGQGIMETFNGGTSWSHITTGLSGDDLYFYNIEISPVNTQVIYATGYLWPWKSNNGGSTWEIADTSYPDFNTWGLALHPTNVNIAFVGSRQKLFTDYYGGGIYKTTNGGASFIPKLNGLDNTFVLDVESDPNDPNFVIVGTWGSGVYWSPNNGLDWYQGNDGLWLPYIYSIEATQGTSGTVFYASTFYTGAALFVSYDQGKSWTQLPTDTLPGFAQNGFDIESVDGSSERLVVATANGIYYSNDAAQTWTQSQVGGDPSSGIILDIEGINNNRMVAATYGDGIYYSTNSGVNWSLAQGEPSDFVYKLSAAPDSSHIYAATFGLAKSNNNGVNWESVQTGVPDNLFFRTVDHGSDGKGHVYAGSIGQGMWAAPDSTDYWIHFSDGFSPPRVRAINADFKQPSRLFVGTDGQSAWYFVPDKLPFVTTSYLPITTKK